MSQSSLPILTPHYILLRLKQCLELHIRFVFQDNFVWQICGSNFIVDKDKMPDLL